jgi:lysophospholipase L1-like esterase
MRRLTLPWVLLIISAVLFVLLVIINLVPLPYTIREEFDGNSVYFSASDSFLFQPGDCFQLAWEVTGPPSLEVDGRGRSGVKQEERCVDGDYRPSLKLNLADGRDQFYAIELHYMVYQPLFWMAIFAIVLLAYSGFYLLFRQWAAKETVSKPHIVYRAFTGFITLLLLIFVSLLTIEYGLKFYLGNYGSNTMKDQFLLSPEDLIGQAEARLVLRPVPFITYLPQFYLLNNYGYRGKDIVIPKPEGVYRIAALGGSTTYGTGTEDPSLAYPAQLERLLHEAYGYTNVEVINAGVPTWNTWSSLSNLAFRVLEVEPDMILIFHGINDTYPRAVEPECFHRVNPYWGLPPNWGHVDPKAFDYGVSTLWRFLGINQGWMPDPVGQASGIEVQLTFDICPGRAEDPLAAVQQNSAHFFERNMRSMIGIAKIHNINVMFATWTYYQLRDFEVYATDEHNAITTKLAEEYDLPFYDLYAEFPVDRALWTDDFLHMNAEGNLIQAELFAEYLGNSHILPQP